MTDLRSPREGEIYKTLTVGGKQFTLVYGFYSEEERESSEPLPIYPDLSANPEYAENGQPIVTRIQDACRHYQPIGGAEGEGWCADCIYYPHPKEEIGICKNPQNGIVNNPPLEEA